MKTYKKTKAAAEQTTSNNHWDEFTQYLDSIYFEGAAEVLDQELVSFEYHEYISSIVS